MLFKLSLIKNILGAMILGFSNNYWQCDICCLGEWFLVDPKVDWCSPSRKSNNSFSCEKAKDMDLYI